MTTQNITVMSYEWQWRSNISPLTWKCYTDLETRKLEESYQKNEENVLFDAYHIDLQRMIQISNTNLQKQRPIRRMFIDRIINENKMREERFFADPLLPARSFITYRIADLKSSFIQASFHYFGITFGQVISLDERKMLADKAADGLIIEGALVGKKHDGEGMANYLRESKRESKRNMEMLCMAVL